MPDESFPIEIGGETLHLRFEDKDVREIEKTLALFAAFHPSTRTYENAALFLWRGLRRQRHFLSKMKKSRRWLFLFLTGCERRWSHS